VTTKTLFCHFLHTKVEMQRLLSFLLQHWCNQITTTEDIVLTVEFSNRSNSGLEGYPDKMMPSPASLHQNVGRRRRGVICWQVDPARQKGRPRPNFLDCLLGKTYILTDANSDSTVTIKSPLLSNEETDRFQLTYKRWLQAASQSMRNISNIEVTTRSQMS